MNRSNRVCALAVLLVVGVGCGQKSGPTLTSVAGKVTIEGQPVTSGQVEFFSTSSGIGAMAIIKDDGTYKLNGQISSGEYAVSVQGVVPEPGQPPAPPTKIPRKYWTAKTSGLSFIVPCSDGDYDISLSAK